jgi:hypothetical protein
MHQGWDPASTPTCSAKRILSFQSSHHLANSCGVILPTGKVKEGWAVWAYGPARGFPGTLDFLLACTFPSFSALSRGWERLELSLKPLLAYKVTQRQSFILPPLSFGKYIQKIVPIHQPYRDTTRSLLEGSGKSSPFAQIIIAHHDSPVQVSCLY